MFDDGAGESENDDGVSVVTYVAFDDGADDSDGAGESENDDGANEAYVAFDDGAVEACVAFTDGPGAHFQNNNISSS